MYHDAESEAPLCSITTEIQGEKDEEEDEEDEG